MGKFDGMLLVSDFDNTLLYTAPSLRDGLPCPDLDSRNLAAIRRWMEEGGTFAVATGRSLAGYRRPGRQVPTNAPTIVDNGGSIYDFRTGRYVLSTFLPENARDHIAQVMEAFPQVSVEMCHEGDLVQVMRPTAWNDQHAKLTGAGYRVVDHIGPDTVPLPLAKAMFVADRATLDQVKIFAAQAGWAGEYEMIFSSSRLLELTARGANKGNMVKKLEEICGCTCLICAGDHLNDLPMLQAADRAFCPANAVPEVLAADVTRVCHCKDGAIGEIVAILEREVG